jgi:hypothetical protein
VVDKISERVCSECKNSVVFNDTFVVSVSLLKVVWSVVIGNVKVFP